MIYDELSNIWKDNSAPIIEGSSTIYWSDIEKHSLSDIDNIRDGTVVALVGDFDPKSIRTLIKLIEKKCIIVPLTKATRNSHDYFFDAAHVEVIVEDGTVQGIRDPEGHHLVNKLKEIENPGLVLFTTGTTGRPKAILHDMTKFLERYKTKRPTLRTLAFLLFDHIGGINTLLHTLYNSGTVISLSNRDIETVVETCKRYNVELLPTTPTFLRLLMISGRHTELKNLRVITYGTEKMDQSTLNFLSSEMPFVDFRQTFGMSELGILRVKSKSKDSLFMKIGGEGVEWKVNTNNELLIKSESRMCGYLNAPSPFDEEDWYNTGDVVEVDGDFIKVTGRSKEVVNFGGLKFLTTEVEEIALQFSGVNLCKAYSASNPITGQHCELLIQVDENFLGTAHLKAFLKTKLDKHKVPAKIRLGDVTIGHRFKKS